MLFASPFHTSGLFKYLFKKPFQYPVLFFRFLCYCFAALFGWLRRYRSGSGLSGPFPLSLNRPAAAGLGPFSPRPIGSDPLLRRAFWLHLSPGLFSPGWETAPPVAGRLSALLFQLRVCRPLFWPVF